MKKLLLFICGFFLIAFLAFQISARNTPQPPLTPTPSPRLPVSNSFNIPTHFSVPKLDISTNIEAVGLDNTGGMAIPKDYQSVGWYRLGYKPGEKGSVVIAGHYDTPKGTPGVFYRISTLEKGDSIMVTDDKNNQLTYTVDKVEIYPLDTFPLQTVFASTDTYRLNLITCNGVFDRSTKLYNKRLVVFAVLKTP